MLFAAGIGTGIMFYAIAEPVAQYIAPPNGSGETIEAARAAVTWTLFHYGISGWGLYWLVGIALGYFAYRRRDRLAVRSTLRPILGSRVDGLLGDIVDVFALVGGVFGIAASLGIGVVQLNVGLTLLFGIPQGLAAQIGLVSLSVVMATVSAVSGVDKGVRILSNINVLLAMGLALWVLITGNTAFLLDALVANIGDFVTRFPALTLETFPYDRPDAWLNGWTLSGRGGSPGRRSSACSSPESRAGARSASSSSGRSSSLSPTSSCGCRSSATPRSTSSVRATPPSRRSPTRRPRAGSTPSSTPSLSEESSSASPCSSASSST